MLLPSDCKQLEELTKLHVDQHGRATDKLQRYFSLFEERYRQYMNDAQRKWFQTLVAKVGAKMTGNIELPTDSTPFWLTDAKQWHSFRSSDALPTYADIVVIGAGLTGASAAYHLSKHSGRSVVVVDASFPGAEASGRNGGNFQLMSESHHGCYDGMVEERRRWLKILYPSIDDQKLQAMAESDSRVVYDFTKHNMTMMDNLVQTEKLDCDYSNKGWLRIAGSAEEERSFAQDHAYFSNTEHQMPEWSAINIRHTTRVDTDFGGRLMEHSGNYHPFKYLCGLLEIAMKKGVRLYAQCAVTTVKNTDTTEHSQKMHVQVVDKLHGNAKHTIRCKRVIVATNAFTPGIFPHLQDDIHCYVSHIANWEHVQQSLQGMTITEQEGDIYYNTPLSTVYKGSDGTQRGMLHFGLDNDEPSSTRAYERNYDHFKEMTRLVHQRFPDTVHQPPSRYWAGPMGLTVDRTPMIGFFDSLSGTGANFGDPDTNIVMAVAFQGFGGSFCTYAGYVAAEMAISGAQHPDVPLHIFSPHRFSNMDSKQKQRLLYETRSLGYSCTYANKRTDYKSTNANQHRSRLASTF